MRNVAGNVALFRAGEKNARVRRAPPAAARRPTALTTRGSPTRTRNIDEGPPTPWRPGPHFWQLPSI